MSKTVDERVVSMQFDNKHFEQNVSTTMSTLDKLKQKLNLSGASKGLENVNAAAKKVDMSGLGTAVETVRSKFSALEVMSVTALANITNSAVNAGKRIVSALTIDPVKTGFSEYETKINAIQTIKSNTASKGTTMDEITATLDELNKYADKTIYNFAEMTRNIGTFTAAGVGLKESASAIQGIANLAASSGSTSQQASTAMYQLSQALAAGSVKLMDWNSVVNAGMGGQLFQDALKETAREYGVNVDAMIEKNGSFRESLREEWISADILNTTLSKFTKEGAKEYAESMIKSGKYTKEQADALMKQAQDMEDAATKVKTLTQLWDTLKESAQSGWSQTWELIIGNFDEAQELFSGLYEFIGGFIDKMNNARNKVLEIALNNPFAKSFASLSEKINKVTKASDALTTSLKALKDPAEVVDSVIRGDWGNTQKRWDALTEAGYDWVEVQNLVNEKLGSSVRRTSQFKNEQKELNKTQAVTIEQLLEMSDVELKNLGFEPDEIKAFRQLGEYAEKTGYSVEELAKDIDLLSGRSLLINSFKNTGKALLDVFKALKTAWREVFPDDRTEEQKIEDRAASLYDALAAVHKFTRGIRDLIYKDDELTETGKKLVRTFEGVFAIFDLVATVTGGALRIAFKLLKAIMGAFNIDVLDLTAGVSDAIIAFRDWFKSIFDLEGLIKKLIPYVTKAKDAIVGWFKGIKDAEDPGKYIADGIINGFKYVIKVVKDVGSEIGNKILDGLKSVFGIETTGEDFAMNLLGGIKKGFGVAWDVVSELVGSLVSYIVSKLGIDTDSEFIQTGKNVVQGLVNGIKDGFGSVGEVVMDLATLMIDKVKEILGIHSPSTVFMALGMFIITGLIIGLQNGTTDIQEIFTGISEFVMTALDKLLEFIKDIDLGQVLAAGLAIGSLVVFKQFVDALDGIGDALGGFGDMCKDIGGYFKAKKWKDIGNTILKFAIAIGVLVAAIVILANVAKDNSSGMWQAVGVIGVLIVAIAALAAVAVLMEKFGGGSKSTLAIVGIGAALLLVALAIGKLASIGDIGPALKNLAMIELLFLGVMLISKAVGEHADKAGKMMIKMSLALLVMIAVVKIAAKLSPSEVSRGITVVGMVELLFLGVMVLSELVGEHADKAGSMFIKMSAAILILVGVMYLISFLDDGDVLRSLGVITVMMVMMGTVTYLASKIKDPANMAKVFNSLAISIGILAIIMIALTFIDPVKLATSVGALVTVMAGFALLMAATSKLNTDKGVMTKLYLLLGVVVILAGVVVGLSLIPNPNGAITSAIAVGVLLTVMTANLLMLDKVKSVSKSTLGTLGIITAVVVGLAITLGVMNGLGAEASISSALAIGVLLTILSANLLILDKVRSVSSGVLGSLLIIAIVAVALGNVLRVLAGSNSDSAISNSIAIGVLLTIMSANIAILSIIKMVSPAAMLALGVITAIVVILADTLLTLSTIDSDAALKNVVALSVLLIAMSAVCAILSVVGMAGPAALIGAGVLLGVIAIIGQAAIKIGELMSEIPQDKIETWKSGLTTFMDFIVLLAQGLGNAIGAFIGGVAEGIMGILPALGTALSDFWNNAKPFFDGMNTLDEGTLGGVAIVAAALAALTVASLVNSIIGFLPTMVNFALLGGELTAFWIAAKPFFDGVKDVGADTLSAVSNIAEAILMLTAANLVNQIAGFISMKMGGDASMASFGNDLATLGEGVQGFCEAVKNIPEDALTKAETAAGIISTMAGVAKELPGEGGWLQKIMGEQDIGNFGTKLASLGESLKTFSASLVDFDDDDIKRVKNGAKAVAAIAEVTKDIPAEGGFLQKLVGTQDIKAFGEKLPTLGNSIRRFVTNLTLDGEFGDDQVEAAKNGAKAVAAIAEVAKDIPAEGGWMQAIVGTQDISKFGSQMADLGTHLYNFVYNIGEFTGGDVITAENGAKAVKAMADVAQTIPTGSFWSNLFGDDEGTGLADFGEELADLGESLSDFSGYLTDWDPSVAESAVQSVVNMANAAATLEEHGLDGDDSALVDFVSQLAGDTGVGEKLDNFNWWISGIDTVRMLDAMSVVSRMANTAATIASKGVNEGSVLLTFVEQVRASGEKLDNFNWWISDINHDNIDLVISDIKKLADCTTNLAGYDVTGLNSMCDSFGKVTDLLTSMSSVKSDAASGFIAAFEDLASVSVSTLTSKFEEVKTEILDIGKGIVESFSEGIKRKKSTITDDAEDIVDKFASGITDNEDTITSAFETAMSACVTAIENYYNDFYDAGAYTGAGFIAGVNSKKTSAATAGGALGRAALIAAKRALNEHSPSKEMYKVGAFAGEGFINALTDYVSKAYDSSAEMAFSARDGISDSIASIARAIDSGIDVHPTIRPVIDLSEVRAGADAISGMLPDGNTLYVDTRGIGAVSLGMSKIQNGRNSNDVVSAIKALRKDISNMPRNTYNVNGITYDDGSNISTAVESLVRAARIERRK